MMRINAYAKINLFLHIIDRLPNGYHELESLFAWTDISDEITLNHAEESVFTVKGPFATMVPDSGDNLLLKMIESIESYTATRLGHFSIELTKNIPVGAGLGGGSADAAMLLKAINQLCELELSKQDLEAIALTIGTDVVSCLYSQSCLVRGIGDHIKPVDMAGKLPYALLVYPSKSLSTKWVYRSVDMGAIKPVAKIDESMLGKSMFASHILPSMANHLFDAASKLYPKLDNIVDLISQQQGCSVARMSGSGSTCFGLFDKRSDADAAARVISTNNPNWWVQSTSLY